MNFLKSPELLKEEYFKDSYMIKWWIEKINIFKKLEGDEIKKHAEFLLYFTTDFKNINIKRDVINQLKEMSK